MNRKHIAVFGGAFNPPTLAHAEIVSQIIALNRFAEIWIMPSNSRLDKEIHEDRQSRLEMLELFIKENFANQPVRLSTIEIDSTEQTETHYTLKKLYKIHPSVLFTYVIGADSLETLHEWHEADWLYENVHWLVVPRDGAGKHITPPKHLAYLKQPSRRISSTLVRERIKVGKPITKLVGMPIEQFIQRNGLYQ